jgi:citrate lyase alpha subunit
LSEQYAASCVGLSERVIAERSGGGLSDRYVRTALSRPVPAVEAVNVVVTDHGVAVNPTRKHLVEHLQKAKLPLFTIEELRQKAEDMVGIPDPVQYTDKVVGVVTYRDGTIIDLIRQIRE